MLPFISIILNSTLFARKPLVILITIASVSNNNILIVILFTLKYFKQWDIDEFQTHSLMNDIPKSSYLKKKHVFERLYGWIYSGIFYT